jgi:hypothetical protein
VGVRRDIHTLQRQIANVMPGRAVAVHEFPPSGPSIVTEETDDDHLLRRCIAFGVIALVALTLYALLFHDIPERNETTLGVVIGFVFGNMVGPMFRAMFGANDENRELANKAMSPSPRATGKAIPP